MPNGKDQEDGSVTIHSRSSQSVPEILRPELVWPGKYDSDGRRVSAARSHLPFQVIERVREIRVDNRGTNPPQTSLFDVYEGREGDTTDAGWHNKLIWGDNLLVATSLLERFAGKVSLIYIDPPFLTQADFSFESEIGDGSMSVTKEQSSVEEKVYRDTWGRGIESYLQMLYERLTVMRDLLSPNGSIYVHLDATVGHYVKVVMDEIFGAASFQRQIIWRIGWVSGYKTRAKNWIRNHDLILFYVKTPGNFTFNKEYVPYHENYRRRGGQEATGPGYPAEDVWNANPFEFELSGEDSFDSIQIKSFSSEKTGFPTQKNESLLRRIIKASSNSGELVADLFCGSGTTLAVAEKLNRRWIGCDLSRFAMHVSRKRLLDIPTTKPFEILNLGKYERQYWQSFSFGARAGSVNEQTMYEYLAFVLRLYGAQPLTGMVHLHGKKEGAMVYIGAVDTPVTIDEINDSLDECVAIKQRELHVLGWEWEMGLAGPNNNYRKGGLMHEVAKEKGIKLSLLQIPREVMERQAAAKGDVQFFELAYVDVDVQKTGKRGFRLTLKDFVIPNTDLIPVEVREKVKQSSDYVDYWAVDWDFQNDAFMPGWVSYRTRRDRKLSLATPDHHYEVARAYRILVKVIDIFGNDSSQVYEVTVS